MNKKMRFLILITCFTILFALFTSGCASSANKGDKFVMGGTYRLNENETIDGNLSVFGGAISLEKGSTVNGNVILIGGTINAAGIINGGVNGLGGSITLSDTAVVQGDVTTVGAAVNKSDKAKIQGKVVSQSEGGVQLPDLPRIAAPALIKPFGDALGGLLRALVIGVLAVLVTLFFPRQIMNVGDAIVDNPFTTAAIGLLTLILFPFIVIILFITIFLIPLSLIAVFIFVLGLILGLIAVGLEMGKKIASLFKGEWAPAVSAGVGTLVLSLLAILLGAIPCVSWVVPTVIVFIATGGVVISVFGSKGKNNHPLNQTPAGPISPVPPSQPPQNVVPVPPVMPIIVPEQSVDKVSETPLVDALLADMKKDSVAFPSINETTMDIKNPEKKVKPRTRKPKPGDDSLESK
jgi:hypothetical protein